MATILRDTEVRICRDHNDKFPTVSSQVKRLLFLFLNTFCPLIWHIFQISAISPNKSENRHWFTASQNTKKSTFKLIPSFYLLATQPLSPLTKSFVSFPDKAQVSWSFVFLLPWTEFDIWFQTLAQREHQLWSWHVRQDWRAIDRSDPVFEPFKKLESDQFKSGTSSARGENERNSFHDAVCKELELIKNILEWWTCLSGWKKKSWMGLVGG